MDFIILIKTFIIVYGLNLIPAFSPPTWMFLSSYVLFTDVEYLYLFVLAAALGATLGRYTLAKLSHLIIRSRLLSMKTKKNIDFIEKYLLKNKKMTIGVLFVYCLSPFPSNQLFIAYGLTNLKLRFLTIPFFIGRMISYSIGVYGASLLSKSWSVDFYDHPYIFSFSFVLIQLGILSMVYLFAKIDWKSMIKNKKIRFIKNN